MAVTVDHKLGGRWTSLRGAEREWLWHHPDPTVQAQRRQVEPGDAFVDAGGVEEALPTVRGTPDHGDVWSRPWQPLDGGAGAEVSCVLTSSDGPVRGRLRRAITVRAGTLQADYRVSGPVGASFLHAVHVLLQLSPAARVDPRGDVDAVELDEQRPGRSSAFSWPSGFDRLGPDDGTATCVLLRRCRQVRVVDGPDRLAMTWSADDARVCSLLLWRNLGGWPRANPYRSIGVEPLIGRWADVDTARPEALAAIPEKGYFTWSLRLRAHRQV